MLKVSPVWWLAALLVVACLPLPRSFPGKSGPTDVVREGDTATSSHVDSGTDTAVATDTASGGDTGRDSDADLDGDGYSINEGDCDDDDASIHPWDKDGDEIIDGCGWRAVAAGPYHTCGIKSDGNITCWGEESVASDPAPQIFSVVSAGDHATCGLTAENLVDCWGTDTDLITSEPGGQFMTISTGSQHACGVTAWNTTLCWGQHEGYPSTELMDQVSAGASHTCGITTEGAIVCWGSDELNQVSGAPGDGLEYTAISSGRNTTCAIGGGQVKCWGYNGGGIVSDKPGGAYATIAVGVDFACVTKGDGSPPYCWGSEHEGQLLAPDKSLHGVSAGDQHACGIRTDGHLECWGSNLYTQTEVPGSE